MSLIVNDLPNICLQRARRQLLNVPIFRFELVSPYGGAYSKFDFDMRRKAEVLKYNGNATNTKTNNSTKAQLFSQLVTNTQIASVNNNTTKCVRDSSNNLIYRPTTDSDVPGPVILLYDDETVPLYNYGNFLQNRFYPDQMPNDFKYWKVYTSDNILSQATGNVNQYSDSLNQSYSTIPTTVETTLFTIYILPNINKSTYTYTINTPISISIGGNYTNNNNLNFNVNLNSVNINVYYNTTVINGPTFPTKPNISGIFSDISLNIPANAGVFNAQAYIGNLVFQIPNLPTLNGYIFDIKLAFTFDSFKNDIIFFSKTDSIKLNIIMNSSLISKTSQNCSIKVFPNPPITPYSSFSLSGV